MSEGKCKLCQRELNVVETVDNQIIVYCGDYYDNFCSFLEFRIKGADKK